MKKLLLTFLILLFSLSSNIVWSANYDKGLDAFNSGDYATALREWRPLAEKGDDDAQYGLGYLYDDGLGVIQDYKTALKWFRLAASQGQRHAQFVLGIKNHEGDNGVIQNYKTAVKWYTLSAEQGYADAQTSLGVMYVNGHGTLQDNVYAHMWWNIAAANGNEDAKYNRDRLVKMMTSADISAAQKLARECLAKNYKGC